MSVYMTEQEQLEAIKKWWQRHNGVITVIGCIVLLIVASYRYWNWHQDKVVQQASRTYEQLMLAFSNQDNKAVRGFANQLMKEHKNTVYADAARLTLAKISVSHEKFAQAEEQLHYVATHSKLSAFQQIAKIRLARLLITDKLYDKALNELNLVNDPSYTPVVNEIRGDIYAATGHYGQAITSYHQAIEEGKIQGIGNLFLEMKTNELAARNQSDTASKEESQAS